MCCQTQATIDYLKIDVERSEWASLSQMLTDGVLSKVKQLGIEVHLVGTDSKSLLYMYDILMRLEDQGFRRWHSNLNLFQVKLSKHGFRSSCYEMVYINANFLQ